MSYNAFSSGAQALSLHDVARALGGVVAGRDSVLAPGPGHGPRDRSLSVRLSDRNPDGFTVHSHSGDDWQECRDYVRERLGLPSWQPRSRSEREPPAAVTLPVSPADETNKLAALRIWAQTLDARGTIVDDHLRRERAISLDADDLAWESIRFHRALTHKGRAWPGMVALFRDILTDEPVAIHRTFLTREGKKVDRAMLGPARGAAIKLDPDAEVTGGVVIGEGIETCLSARIMRYRPCWALGSAGAIGTFPLLHEAVEAITLLKETDDSGANARGCDACADRWLAAGREVIDVTPLVSGDLNDLLKGAAA